MTADSLASQTAANATASQLVSGYTAWANGSKITGTIALNPSKTITASSVSSSETALGNTNESNINLGKDRKVTLPAGYYSSPTTIQNVSSGGTGLKSAVIVDAAPQFYQGTQTTTVNTYSGSIFIVNNNGCYVSGVENNKLYSANQTVTIMYGSYYNGGEDNIRITQIYTE